MTNLSPNYKNKKLITPENSLLFIPILIGILILTSLLTFAYRPLVKKLSKEESQIKLLEEKISYIPVYKKFINELSIRKNNAKRQQERLINLISDPEELNTILTEIDRICEKNEIEIMKIEPKPIIKYSSLGLKDSDRSASKDPFLIPSIEKHIFNITLKGDFNSLLRFLKEIELLQTIAITDEIQIKSSSSRLNKDKIDLTMSFSLTTYARIIKYKAKI